MVPYDKYNAITIPVVYKIFLVDDEKDILNVIKNGLTKRGFYVDAYDSSIEALKNYKSFFYDLILLDIKMPQMNGYELYQKIRERDPYTTILFMSAFETFSNIPYPVLEDLIKKNFIKKPITIRELTEIIASITDKFKLKI